MFMFPDPYPKDYRLRFVSMNCSSSELITPDAFPRCSQANLGLYSYPLKNTSNQYDIQKVRDKILDKWTQDAKAWWIGKPSENAHMMFEMHQKVKDTREIDPRFKPRNSIFPRSYQYEQECVETKRLQKLFEKVQRDEKARTEAKDTPVSSCICLENDVKEKLQRPDSQDECPRWQKPPELFAESQHDPCKRRAEFQKFGQTFKTEACCFYYDNYPPPPVSKHIQKFVK